MSFGQTLASFRQEFGDKVYTEMAKGVETLLGTKVPRSLVASWCLVRFKKLALVPPLFQKEVTTDTPA